MEVDIVKGDPRVLEVLVHVRTVYVVDGRQCSEPYIKNPLVFLDLGARSDVLWSAKANRELRNYLRL